MHAAEGYPENWGITGGNRHDLAWVRRISHHGDIPSPGETHSALFVRLPTREARKLDRAAWALAAPKKDLVAGLVARYVDPDSTEGLAALRELAPASAPRRVIIESGAPPLTVGHAEFRPAELGEVLTAAQAAQFLQVDEALILAMAEDGRLPGRRLGEHWRFARPALIAWLAEG